MSCSTVRLQTTASLSRVKHSTTEPLRALSNLSLIGPVVSEKMFENVADGQTMDGRRTDARVTGILLAQPLMSLWLR